MNLQILRNKLKVLRSSLPGDKLLSPEKKSQFRPPRNEEEEQQEMVLKIVGNLNFITKQILPEIHGKLCPNNVLADVDRLEILIGGRRAGNNSPEIIKEAVEICQRLFTGGIMDISVYRAFV